MKSRVKLNVGTIVDDEATAQAATAELVAQAAARLKAAKTKGLLQLKFH